LADGEQILLRRRAPEGGFDVIYRAEPVAARLLGCDVDAAEATAAASRPAAPLAHRVAVARALVGADACPPRRNAWALGELAEAARTEAERAAAHFAPEVARAALVTPVQEAEAALIETLDLQDAAPAALTPDRPAVAAAAERLEAAFADLVAQLRDAVELRATLAPSTDEIVAAAWAAPSSLLARLRAELPIRVRDVDDAAPIPRSSTGVGTGSALTVAGRITYGLRLVAGCVTAAGCTTPAQRLFGPGGVAVALLARFDGDVRALPLILAALDPGLSLAFTGALSDA